MNEFFLIADDMVVEGRIARSPGIHPELTFKYRPAYLRERAEFIRRCNATPSDKSRYQAELLAEHIKSWSATNRDGSAADLKAATLRSLQPELSAKLADVVLGYAASTPAE